MSIDDKNKNFSGFDVKSVHLDAGDVIKPTCLSPLSDDVDLYLTCGGKKIRQLRKKSTVVTLGKIKVFDLMNDADCTCVGPDQDELLRAKVKFVVKREYISDLPGNCQLNVKKLAKT